MMRPRSPSSRKKVAQEEKDKNGGSDDEDEDEDDEVFSGPDKAGPLDIALAFVVITLNFTYTTISKYLLGLIRCRRLDPGEHVYLLLDMNIQCQTTSHNAWMFAVFVFTLAYVIGVPTLAYMYLAAYVDEMKKPNIRYRLGFLYKGQEIPYGWYWELVILLRKLAMVMVTVFVVDDPLHAAHSIVWVLQIALVAHLTIDPYESYRQSRLELCSMSAQLVTYHIGLLLYEGVSQDMQNLMGLVVYSLNLGVLVLFGRSVMLELQKEQQVAMYARAKADLKQEEKIRLDHVGRQLNAMAPQVRKLHPRLAAELKASFADDSLKQVIATNEVSDLRLKHLQLSINLENLRNNWRNNNTKGKAKQKAVALEDLARQRKRAAVPAERWRQRRQEEEAAAREIAEEEERQKRISMRQGETAMRDDNRATWQERMADHTWRVNQRLKYRLADEDRGSNRGGTTPRSYAGSESGFSETSATSKGSKSSHSKTERSSGKGPSRSVSRAGSIGKKSGASIGSGTARSTGSQGSGKG